MTSTLQPLAYATVGAGVIGLLGIALMIYLSFHDTNVFVLIPPWSIWAFPIAGALLGGYLSKRFPDSLRLFSRNK